MINYTWNEAKRAVQNLNRRKSSQYHDWRMPTSAELMSIIDHGRVNPACKLPDMQASNYWSSTTNAHYTDYAWGVNFSYGYVGNCYKSCYIYVRAVRGGLDGNRLEWSETL